MLLHPSQKAVGVNIELSYVGIKPGKRGVRIALKVLRRVNDICVTT